MHRELKVALSVYVDDFKMAGAPAAMTAAWKKIKSVINVDDPTLLGKYLGCNDKACDVPADWIDKESMSTLLRDGSDEADSLAAKPDAAPPTKGTPTGKKQRGTRYDMHGLMEQRVEL